MTFAELLRKYQGQRSLRQFARDLAVDPSLLVRLYSGERTFSAAVLWRLLLAYPDAAEALPGMASIYAEVA